MHLSLTDIALLILAGLAAGVVNGIAGGGSLLTFPALIATGLPAVSANVTNSLSVTPGYLSSVYGSRRDLAGQGHRIKVLIPIALAGGVAGCILLLITPADVFEYIVPFLVLSATAVLAFQTRLRSFVGQPARSKKIATMTSLTFFGAAYGGYFGAALGVVLVAVLALVLDETLRRVNALKNVLSATVGVVTVVVYALFGPVSWLGVAVTAPATIAGGYLGAKLAQRLSAQKLRYTIVTFGTTIGLVLLYRAF